MGKIMRNGNTYGAGGGGTTYTAGTGIEITDQDVINAKVVTLTQAEYDALVQQEEVDLEAVYYISDGVAPNTAVTDVKMNNVSVVTDHVANIPLVSSSTNGVVPQGTAVSTQSQSTKFLREDGTWQVPSYTSVSDRALIDGSNIANPTAFRSAIGLTTNTTTLTNPVSQVYAQHITKKNDVVYLYIDINNLNTTTEVVIGTIPSGYRPLHRINYEALVIASSDASFKGYAHINIQTNGNITYKSLGSYTGSFTTINIAYPVN